MHRLFESIVIAIQSLIANKLRAILTLLGMIIGVMTVIAVVSIINGMNNKRDMLIVMNTIPKVNSSIINK